MSGTNLSGTAAVLGPVRGGSEQSWVDHHTLREDVGFCKIAQAIATNSGDHVVVQGDDGRRHLFTFRDSNPALANYRFGDRVSMGDVKGYVLMTDLSTDGTRVPHFTIFEAGGMATTSVGGAVALGGAFVTGGALLAIAGAVFWVYTSVSEISFRNSRYIDFHKISSRVGVLDTEYARSTHVL